MADLAGSPPAILDSMSALGIPAYGYGIRYENGLFEQRISDGWQQEFPEDWLAHGNPWELNRREAPYSIGFGGTVEYLGGDDKTARALWYPAERVFAVPYDTPIAGWRGRHANMLRLWSARAVDADPLAGFQSRGLRRCHRGARAERGDLAFPLSQRLDAGGTGAAAAAGIFLHVGIAAGHGPPASRRIPTLDNLAEQAAVQLNDTHPAIAVAELMRILVDDHDFAWDQAWTITRATLSYTNHTLLPEALESWPAELFGRLLPRHLQIIYLINHHHLQETRRRGLHDPDFLSAVSLVQENGDRRVRMAHLAFLGSHCVNGVSRLHTELMRKTVFHDLAQTTSTRIVNKTNGITFRRWLFEANRPLTRAADRHARRARAR